MKKADLSKRGRENWKRDEEVTRCLTCSARFGLLTRKHHCRACGDIFCWRCTTKQVDFTPHTRMNDEGYQEKKKRVCEACFKNIVEMQRQLAEEKARANIARSRALALRKAIRRSINLSLVEIARLQAQLEERDGLAVELDEVMQFYSDYKQQHPATGEYPDIDDFYEWQESCDYSKDGCAVDVLAQVCVGNFQDITEVDKMELRRIMDEPRGN